MASTSAISPHKRLLSELQRYHAEPNDALLDLGPVADNDLMEWRAVLRGVDGTAYEGALGAALLTSRL